MSAVFMKGNEAMAESAIRAGARFFSAYPITPQTTFTEYMAKRMPEAGGVFIQSESELSAASMIIGASTACVRCLTATSGPGLSLMQESLSSLAAARLPCVLVDIQRVGGGQAGIVSSQMDYNLVTKSLGHGGLKGMVLAPSTCQEGVDLVYEAFDLADKYRVPVIILTDALTGQMAETVELKPFKTEFPDKSEYQLDGAGDAGRPRRIILDTNIYGPYNGDRNSNVEYHLMEDDKVYKSWDENEVRSEDYLMEDAEYVVITYGTTARIARTTIDELREEGYKVGMIRPITLVPFPKKRFEALDPAKVKGVLVTEMAIPMQFANDVIPWLDRSLNVETYARAHNPVTAEALKDELLKMIRKEENA